MIIDNKRQRSAAHSIYGPGELGNETVIDGAVNGATLTLIAPNQVAELAS